MKREVILGNEINILPGYPFDSNKFSNENGKQLIRIRDLQTHASDTYFAGTYNKNYLVKEGDILIGMDGDFNIIKWKGTEGLLNQRILKISQKLNSDVHIDYAFFVLSPILLEINEKTAATTVKHLSTYDISKLKLELPPLPVQCKIARILSTIDGQIEKTEAIIAKYQAIKQGMLQDLFTRGIDVRTGQLRPRHEDAPELYKESALGMIPTEWDHFTVGELLKNNCLLDVQDGNHGEMHPKSNDFVDEGVPFVMATDIINGQIDLKHCKRITRIQFQKLRIGFAKSGDVLLSHKASIGFVATVPESIEEVMLTPQVTYYRVNELSTLSSEFLFTWFNSVCFQTQLKILAKQSTRDYIGITAQKQLGVLVPKDIIEQKEISQKYKVILNTLNANINELSKLQVLKQGLMQDLLSGEVEVEA